MGDDVSDDENSAKQRDLNDNAVACPVCGSATVQEKCKVICKSDHCRGRVVYNCAEF
jgi:hypothetical protein